jgi:hypothetical protein
MNIRFAVALLVERDLSFEGSRQPSTSSPLLDQRAFMSDRRISLPDGWWLRDWRRGTVDFAVVAEFLQRAADSNNDDSANS